MGIKVAEKAGRFTESVIREMTRLALKHGAVNLSQGFPDFACPEVLKEAAKAAIDADVNQYAITWGAKRFRDAIAAKFASFNGVAVDPERELTVCCGATEGMIAAHLALVDPGDEVIVFEPFYENYGPDAILSGATPRYVRLHPPDWHIDWDELGRAFTPRTRALILNTPNNPTGKVYTREELERLAALLIEHDVLVFSDEIYEHIVYDGASHVSIASLPGMRERTVTINSLSKTYSVTGWRVGWVIAAPELTAAIRKVHDFLTVGAAAPLQEAGAVALALGPEYYTKLAADYLTRRDCLLAVLRKAGFAPVEPRGAYYITARFPGLGFDDDLALTRHLVEKVGVAVVPGSSFMNDPAHGRDFVRFAFCKKLETLARASERLTRLA